MKFMDKCAHTVETVERRFRSGNAIPVDSARVTEDEWRTVLELIHVLQITCDEAGVRPQIVEVTIQ